MRKEELSQLLHSLGIPVNEGVTSDENINKYPRIVYWPYAERDEMASGGAYVNVATYQISFFARKPQDEKYKELREKLRERNLHPEFNHEFVENDPVFSKTWHTYFNLEVTEDAD